MNRLCVVIVMLVAFAWATAIEVEIIRSRADNLMARMWERAR